MTVGEPPASAHLPVNGVALGCMGMSWIYAPSARDDARSVRVIRQAVDAGVGMIDTADVYGAGANEELVATAVRGRRDEVVVATKIGLTRRPDQERPVPCGRPDHVRAAVDGSLRRLGTDRLDLCYLHRVDPTVPLTDTWGALSGLVQAGKIRWIGLSEVNPAQAAAAHAVHPVSAVQSELSLWTRDALNAVLPWCAANDATFVAFSPLGRGFLTGRLTSALEPDDLRATMPRFAPAAREANLRIVAGVRAVADRIAATPAQVALAWVLAQGAIALAGSSTLEHLVENLAAARVVLDPADRADLESLPAAVGERY